MDFVQRVLISLILTITTVILTTSILTFFGVPPHVFNPYMFYLVALVLLGLFLSPKPVSLLDPPVVVPKQ
jgi:hypothetical protein